MLHAVAPPRPSRDPGAGALPGRLAHVRTPSGVVLLASGLALAACSAVAPRTPAVDVSGCPLELTDAVLVEPGSYVGCTLPEPVARLVRTDYADDELGAPPWESLPLHAAAASRSAFSRQLDTFVAPDGSLRGWIAFDAASGRLVPDPVLAPHVALDLGPGDVDAPPGRLQPPVDAAHPYRPARQAELRRTRDARHPVGALRVAIDPGHLGGDLAAFEDRSMSLRLPGGEPVTLREGDLALRTALELRRKLAERGIEVFLTREAPAAGPHARLAELRPFADAFLRHLAEDPAFLELEGRLSPLDRRRVRVAAGLYAVRKQFVFETLRDRMRRAAQRAPDLLVSIHFNASRASTGESFPQELVAMVRGNYQRQRLYNAYYRFRAIRDALEVDAFNAEAHLAASCLRQVSGALGLPRATANHYPDHQPILGADGAPTGVDAWNGVIFRYADWPTVLVEGPYVDERDEAARLHAGLAEPPHAPGTRTERFAEGLARGIVEWATRWLDQERNDFGPDL